MGRELGDPPPVPGLISLVAAPLLISRSLMEQKAQEQTYSVWAACPPPCPPRGGQKLLKRISTPHPPMLGRWGAVALE